MPQLAVASLPVPRAETVLRSLSPDLPDTPTYSQLART